MMESGFLDLFSPNGEIEKKIMHELHEAFVNQFEDDEIIQIINSVKFADPTHFKSRIHEIFERIAFRSTFQNVISSCKGSQGNEEIKINAVEHYYRRTSSFDFWTGDILKFKEGNVQIIILTPRCDLAHNNCKFILVCEILPIEEKTTKEFIKDPDKLRKYITDIMFSIQVPNLDIYLKLHYSRGVK